MEIPAVHMARFGQGNNRNKKVKDPYGWGSSTVVGILKKREYLGHTVNFKTQKHFKDKKSHYVSEDNWVIFENTQEPIIDQQTFDTVQKLRENVRRYPDGWGEHHVLTGLMYCADCGAKCMCTGQAMERGLPSIPVLLIPRYLAEHCVRHSTGLTSQWCWN